MNIFISGIGGKGLGPLAEIALDAGYSVIGSDQNRSLATDQLERRGIKIYFSQDQKTIAKVHKQNPIDWFIYTSALPDDAPELEFAKTHSIKSSKRDEFLANLIKENNLKLLAIAGTHGKTTTTGMLVWTFKQLGVPISYSVGSSFSFGNSGNFDKKSQFFAYEADEYDRNFLHFSPFIAAIPALDYDHADIYPTQENYLAAFRQFISQTEILLTFKPIQNLLREISPKTKARFFADENYGIFSLAGRAMRQDAKLVLEIMRKIWPEIQKNSNKKLSEKFDEKLIVQILDNFPGTSQRFEKLLDNLFLDYGHTPREITATIQRAREINKSVIVVYQPLQNSRQIQIVQDGGYQETFRKASKIFWLPTFLVRGDLQMKKSEILTPEKIIATMSDSSQKITEVANLDQKLWQKISNLRKDNLVLLIGPDPLENFARQNLQK